MTTELLVTYMASISAVTIVLTQLLKNGVIYPHVPEGAGRDTLLQAIIYALNFILLATTLATRGQWDWNNIVLYLLAATNQTVVSNGVYTFVTRSQQKATAQSQSQSQGQDQPTATNTPTATPETP